MKHIIRTVALVLVVSMLSVTAFAEAFTPSVEQKGAPTVVAPKTEVDGKPAVVVKTANGDVVASDAVDSLKVTPFAEAKEQDPETQEKMEKAYTQIAEAKDLSEIAPELPDVLKELKVETKLEDLVVSDLVNLTVSEELAKALETEGATVDVTFEMKIESGKQLIVLVQNAEGQWIVLSGDAVVVNNDGTVTVSFPVVGPVAFIAA